LASAFMNYPTFEYLFPAINERKRKLVYIMGFFLRCGLRRGEVYAPSQNLEGIAIWYKSSQLKMNLQDLAKAGLTGLIFRLNPAAFIKFKKLGDAKQANRQRLINTDYYLLDCIGIAPEVAKKGYGRLLIESKLEQIEAQKMSCFLETSKLENTEYYQRYGFARLADYHYQGLRSFCMLRKSK
jgi:ribosomal protein S18 acetylase RimI-like enzyme